MAALQNKTIIILSPQSWGKMFVSKHHYALELAKYGNTVYFLNPPDQEQKLTKSIIIEKSVLHPGLYIISHRLPFPYNLKFHFMPLYHFLMRSHIKKILRKIDTRPDIIWSFDLGNLYPFRLFPAGALKIFHPVDEPLNKAAIQSAKDAQILFSVTKEILEKYAGVDVPKHFINHGLSDNFLQQKPIVRQAGDPVRVGFSGNLLRPDIDREIFLKIIKENPEIIFECWGGYEVSQNNIAGSDDESTRQFILALKAASNVILHGAVSSGQLAGEMQQMDAFLICYDINKDQSKGTNYHKVMEYLSTGKVIISNNITTYQAMPQLVKMTDERTNNHALPDLFKMVIHSLQQNNAVDLCEQRRKFAAQNLYRHQIEKIESIINGLYVAKG